MGIVLYKNMYNRTRQLYCLNQSIKSSSYRTLGYSLRLNFIYITKLEKDFLFLKMHALFRILIFATAN